MPLTTAAAEQLFSLANLSAMVGWTLLAVAPRRAATRLVAGRLVPGLLCASYALLALTELPHAAGGFGSLHDVASLFSSPGVLLLGWVHYLAFDLLIGAWEVRDAERAGVPHWLVLPCLAATFMLGPVGLLLYVAIRTARARMATRRSGAAFSPPSPASGPAPRSPR
jgi:hypothetical protein